MMSFSISFSFIYIYGLCFLSLPLLIQSTVYTLSNNFLNLGITVDSSGTCLSSLALSLSLSYDIYTNNQFTPNLFSSTDGNCGSYPTSTSIATSTLSSMNFPTGGIVVTSSASNIYITNITFVDNILNENWNISIVDSSIFWIIQREYLSTGIMIADSFPGVWFTSTTGDYEPSPTNNKTQQSKSKSSYTRAHSTPLLSDWRSLVQIPSYLSLDEALIDPTKGYGYSVANNERIALLGDHTTGDTRRIMLSPSGIAMHASISTGRFAMYRPASVFTQTLGIGAELAVGPYSDGYSFYTGDTKETLLRLDFLSTEQGHGYFSFQVPSNASDTVQFINQQMNIMSAIFQLPMGWINGNSPQCETCVHEISVFPQLNGLFRSVAPPSESSNIPNPPPFNNINPLSNGGCPPISNPFCGYSKEINVVTLSLECGGNGVITDINAAYGTPNLSPTDGCMNFTHNPSCDDSNFLSYAKTTCLGQNQCTLIRKLGDFDPCPNIEKAIVAIATCSSNGGRVVPLPGACPTVHEITSKFISFLLSPESESVSPTGEVSPRWDIVSGNDWAFGGIIDQYCHFILAAYYHAVNTNSTSTVSTWIPTLQLIMNYMLDTMLVNSTYLLTNTNPQADGVANHSLADNWLDDVRMGWNDGIVGAYAVEAFRAYADILVWLGQSNEAQFYYTMHQNMIQAYNTLYWDSTTNMYHDWVDVKGIKRNYFYVWNNFLAIEFGIASPTQASQILTTADNLYANIRNKFNVTEQQLWCTPTNLIPLDPSDLTVDFDNEYVYPAYENGDCFMFHYGFESLARGRIQGAEFAYNRLVNAMNNFNISRLWGQRYSWLQDTPRGSDVITDGYMLMYGSIFGSLNIRPTLLNGIQVLGPAASEFEGANFTFSYLGIDTTVQVQNGYAKVITEM